MKRIILAVLLMTPVLGLAQQTIVFPAVSDEVEGRNDSLWVTMVRVFNIDPSKELTVRRKWVCLPGGGFVDSHPGAPSWEMTAWDPAGRVLVKWGEDLLVGTGSSVGAVGLEIIGDGSVLADSIISDVDKGNHNPGRWSFGQGQLIPAMKEPLIGASHLSWLGGCRNSPCSQEAPTQWDYLRNNIGIVNPNPESLVIQGTVIPVSYTIESGGFSEYPDTEPETFEKLIPPYGWLQFRWMAEHIYGDDGWDQWEPPWTGFIVSLTPNKDLPYYAYASVVFTPDPDSGISVFNDPMFVPAEPGYVAPFAEVFPPKGKDE